MTQQEVLYDLFEDYFGSYQGQPSDYWDWYTWYTEYDFNDTSTWFTYEEVFEFFNEEVEHECDPIVPEPYSISLLLMGCCIVLGLKRKLSR